MKDENCTLIRTTSPVRLDDTDFLKQWGFTSTSCCLCNLDISNTGGHLLQCARCKLAHYCSLDCLQKDFVKHKEVCLLAHEANLKFLEVQAASSPSCSITGNEALPSKDTPRQTSSVNHASNGPSQEEGAGHDDSDVLSAMEVRAIETLPVEDSDSDGEATLKSLTLHSPPSIGNDAQVNVDNQGLFDAEHSTVPIAIGGAGNKDTDESNHGNLTTESDHFLAKNKPELAVGKLDRGHKQQFSPYATGKTVNVGKLVICENEMNDTQLPYGNSNWKKAEEQCDDSVEPSATPQDPARGHSSAKPVDLSKEEFDNGVGMEGLVGGPDLNIGKLELSQYSPNTRKHLISVGKLPASCMEAFDGKHPPVSVRLQKVDTSRPLYFDRGDRAHNNASIANRDDVVIDEKMGGTQELDSLQTSHGSSNQNLEAPANTQPNGCDEAVEFQDPSLSPHQVGQLQAVGSDCQNPISGGQVGKLPKFEFGDHSLSKTTLSPGKLSAAAFKFDGSDDDVSRNSEFRSRLGSPIRQTFGHHQTTRADGKSPMRLNASLMHTFDGHDKAPKAELGTCVDRLPHEVTRCFEQPPSSPRRPKPSPGKLPSFAMRAFVPRTSSQDKLPPAFSKLKQSPRRQWKCYKPKTLPIPSQSIAESDSKGTVSAGNE